MAPCHDVSSITPKAVLFAGEPGDTTSQIQRQKDESCGVYVDEGACVEEGTMTALEHKHKRRRPKSKRGADKPTGFEDYYADGPMTPVEYEEIRKLYDPRIEEALTRYQWKRRMENERRAIFFKYLQYGGIDASQNSGTGVSPKELKQMSTDDARQARSQTMIPLERRKLRVSFEEVARGFWSSYYCNHYNPDNQESIKMATVTIHNFLTYLLYHDVCHEYSDDIDRARRICDLAFVELWKNVQLVQQGPGSFNQGCSMLFGGRYFGSGHDVHTDWVPAQVSPTGRLTVNVARKVVKFAIASLGTHEQATRFQNLATQDQLSAHRVPDIDGFEIISVHEPGSDVRDFYREFAPDLPVVGTIRAKSFRNAAKPELDMSAEEHHAWRAGKAPSYEFDFCLEKDLLRHCYPGQRVSSDVWQINCGVYYFDEVISAYPSFHLVLANDLMLHWKTPREVEDTSSQRAEDPGENGHPSGQEKVVQMVQKDGDQDESLAGLIGAIDADMSAVSLNKGAPF
ncbi:hypothetical protein PDE_07550 [Penicillium oxalicum 114-2]|uniref:Argonaute complex, subunit Arb1 n=1 Tax=Penicillium oxalicum (strain 114-2 / CGMCC 5302) TaxID=933388 RepID=S7ZPE3_PENO1|nr:hypothetical protein PDE_07550 [Penicillium oxalicum 114-2]